MIHIDTHVLRYQVFPCLHPFDYMSLLLASHEHNHLLRMSPCFQYLRMLMTFQFDQLPPISFLSSLTALNIRTRVLYSYKRERGIPLDEYDAFITFVSQLEEGYGMELLKLYRFHVIMDDQKNPPESKPWFIHLMKELTTIANNLPNDQKRIDLIEKYHYFIPFACYQRETVDSYLENAEMQVLCLESAKYGVKRSSILMAVQLPQYYCRRAATVLQYLSEEHRNDKEIVLEAIIRNAIEFQFASRELRRDLDVILAAIKNPFVPILQYMDSDLRDCKELMMKVISTKDYHTSQYRYLSNRLKSDRDIILEMVGKESRFFSNDLSWNLMRDEDLIRQCIVKNPEVMRNVHFSRIKDDVEFVLANPDTFKHASVKVRSNKQVVMQLAHQHGWDKIVPGMCGQLLSDVELWRTILSHNGNLLQYAAPNISSNVELIRIATSMDPNALTGQLFKRISHNLMRNRSFALEMLAIMEKSNGRDQIENIRYVLLHWEHDEEMRSRILQILCKFVVEISKVL